MGKVAAIGGGSHSSFGLWRDKLTPFTDSIEPLYLLEGGAPDVPSALADTDMGWVPGGDARLLLSPWHKTGVDRALRRAFRRGVVMSGRSAGANCWFSYSLGAEPPRRSARFFSYRRNRGLGLVGTTLCTHYLDRREGFRYLSPNASLCGHSSLVTLRIFTGSQPI